MLINFKGINQSHIMNYPKLTIKLISLKMNNCGNIIAGLNLNNIIVELKYNINDNNRTVYVFDNFEIKINNYKNKNLIIELTEMMPKEIIKTLQQFDTLVIDDKYSIIVKNISGYNIKLILIKNNIKKIDFEMNVVDDTIFLENKFRIRLLGQTYLNEYVTIQVEII